MWEVGVAEYNLGHLHHCFLVADMAAAETMWYLLHCTWILRVGRVSLHCYFFVVCFGKVTNGLLFKC